MTKGLIFLILLGCDDSGTLCDVLAQPPESYASREACEVVADRLLDGSFGYPYPVLATQCGTETEMAALLGAIGSPEAVAAAAGQPAPPGNR